MPQTHSELAVASPETIPMAQDHSPRERDFGKTLHCLEVLQAVQTDTRTAGWYWGDVRGKAAVGAATNALLNKGLIHSVVGPPPFRLTLKGEEFIETNRKDWEAFLAHTDQHGIVERFGDALRQIPEESPAVDAL